MKNIYIIDTTHNIEIDGVKYYLLNGLPTKQADGTYSDEDYHQSYANGLIIAQGIRNAYEQGYSSVKIEKGEYSLCAIYPRKAYPSYCIEISEVHNMCIDFSDSTIKLIYDSKNYNPYCLVTSEPAYKQNAFTIGLYRCTGINLKNLNLLGDALDRSWVSGENSMEQTYGITIGQLCKDITIDNINSKCFMGDSINGMATTYPYIANKLIIKQWNVDKTIDSATGEVKDTAPGNDGSHFLLSEPIDLDAAYSAESSLYPYSGTIRDYVSKYSIKGFETKMQFRAPGNAYTYKTNNFGWKVALYSNGKYLKTIDADIFTIIDIKNIDALRLILCDEHLEEGETGLIEKNYNIMLSQVYSHDITIKNCVISDGHRGGMSNLPHNTTIENTLVYNCGQDCGIGAPLFPDSTRYGLNNEEAYTNNLTIRHCRFVNNHNSILFNSEISHIYDSQFINGSVYANAIRTATIENCVFVGCGPASSENVSGWRGGENMISSLVVKNCSINDNLFSFLDTKRRKIVVESCVIQTNEIVLQNNHDLLISDTLIRLIGKGEFVNNRIENVRFSKSKIYGSSQNNGCCINEISGEIEFDNVRIAITPFNTDKVSIEGVKTTNNCAVYYYGFTALKHATYKNCNFQCLVEVLPDNDIIEQSVMIIGSEFTLPDKPIKIMTWNNLSAKTLSVKLKDCTFACPKSNIFEKFTGGSVSLRLKVIGSDFAQ